MPVNDYYNILGIEREATLDTIKKSYRVLALNNHPDRNASPEAKEKFHKVAEAFHRNGLNVGQRRAIYDQYGMDGLKKGVLPRDGFQGYAGNYAFSGNAEEVFSKFFGTKNPFSDFFTAYATPTQQFGKKFGGLAGMSNPVTSTPQDPIVHKLMLTLEQIYTGCVKKIKITRKVLSDNGITTNNQEKILTIEIPPGCKTGTKITFPKQGDQGPNTIPDIVFVVTEIEHENFKRNGNDLIFTANVPLVSILTGCHIDCKTLDGRLLKIPINDVITPDYEKVIPGEGMPGTPRGNLIIKIKSIFPPVLNEQQKKLLKQAFQ